MPTPPKDYEKLGAFFLGRPYDLAAKEAQEGVTLYDAKDLTTHAVCVGMTGSGKTGLCVGLLEEAAIDGIPAIIVDPKGDLANLMLHFPRLRGEDFRPWVEEGEAANKGMSPDEYATAQAELWKKGLAGWGQSPARIKKLKDAADYSIYTPGSTAGLPLSLLRSFQAPPLALREDADLFRERIQGTVTGLLALLGIDADPIQDREHILLSTIFQHAWSEGRELDLGLLIRQIQDPPVTRIGVMDLDSFYPAKARFALAMKLNNLLAAPGFAAWMEGDPLDIGKLLRTPEGKPRISILSIAHLGDAERMFFVSLLFNELVGWMRQQEGTGSLRALVYMDEIAGYCPPSANPPSKAPMLTLLKQARAFGLGLVLSTQNPVDLDYKGLSNCGTWFVGRMQTERDRERLLDGLESAAAGGLDRKGARDILASLKKRVFLLHNVHESKPVVFETRWVMNYLRGPISRDGIMRLMAKRKKAVATSPTVDTAVAATPRTGGERPALAPGITELFAPVRRPAPPGGSLRYRALIMGEADVAWVHSRSSLNESTRKLALAEFPEGRSEDPWDEAALEECVEFDRKPAAEARFGPLPALSSDSKLYTKWEKGLKAWLYREMPVEIFYCRRYKLWSTSGEEEGIFRGRIADTAAAARDLKVDKLRARYESKLATLQERIRKAEQRIDVEQEQKSERKMQTAISIGSTLLGAFLGRKTTLGTVGRAATAMKSAGRIGKEDSDIQRATENLASSQAKLEELDRKFRDEVEALEESFDPTMEEIEIVEVKPRKTELRVRRVALLWLPTWVDADGGREMAWK